MIKVMFVLPSLQFGGAEKKIIDFILRINKSEFYPIVCSLSDDGAFYNLLRNSGIKVYFIKRYFKYDFTVIFRLMLLMLKEGVQIVQTTLIVANIFGRLAALLAKRPIIIATEHSMGIWRVNKYTIVNRLLSYFTHRIIVVSKRQKRFLHDVEGIPNSKMIVIYNGVDMKKFHLNYYHKTIMRKKLGLKQNYKIVGTVGTLRPVKGHDHLIKAAAAIVRKYPNIYFLIIGDGPCRKRLETIVAELGLQETVIFLGNRNEIPELISVFDVFVLSSNEETFPNAILEAMAAEKPVVAMNVGGVSEIVVDGQTGILVPKGNVSKLSDAIIKLITNQDIARKMARDGRNRVEKYFSMERMVNERENLFRTLLKDRGW